MMTVGAWSFERHSGAFLKSRLHDNSPTRSARLATPRTPHDALTRDDPRIGPRHRIRQARHRHRPARPARLAKRSPGIRGGDRARAAGQIIEVGSWKGASAIHMTGLAKKHDTNVVTVCVDTFICWDTFLARHLKHLLIRDEYGFPSTYRQFLYNVAAQQLTGQIFPMPMTSTCGAELMRQFEVQADITYIDAGHREVEVASIWLNIGRCCDPAASCSATIIPLTGGASSPPLTHSAKRSACRWR